MRISWGHKIASVYLVFVAGILFLVFKANSQHWDLVTDDYYEAELKYQDVIDRKANVQALSAMPVYTKTESTVQIRLPLEFEGSAVKGNVYLYRPSDAALDIRKDFSITGRSYNLILPRKLQGMYTIKLSWERAGKEYFDEQQLFF